MQASSRPNTNSPYLNTTSKKQGPQGTLTSFTDTEHAFAYKTDHDLKLAQLLFSTLQSNFLVQIGPMMVNWALKMHLPIEGIIKSYFFNQFCGGTTLEEMSVRMHQLMAFGVASTLDYAVEGQKTERGYNEVAEETKRVIAFAKGKPDAAFIAMKMTGIASIDLMQKKQAGGNLTGYELMQFDKVKERLEGICQCAYDNGQCILIDAEETWIQNVIDDLAEEMMWKYNKKEVVIYTTAQLYRHDRLAYVKSLLQKAKDNNAIAGIKLVRGAYLEKETKRALDIGYTNPMQPNKTATDTDFDAAARFMIENKEHYALYLGTHNEQSCLTLIKEMERLGIEKKDNHVWFGQLFGMSDNITFNLAHAGYNVSKYLPYGPVHAVMPYLFRRAQENTSIAGQTSRELKLISKELERRKSLRAQ